MLPRIDRPDLLFEVHAWTGFLNAFTHISTQASRMEGLLTSLVAEACNVGLTPAGGPTLSGIVLTGVTQSTARPSRAGTAWVPAQANATMPQQMRLPARR